MVTHPASEQRLSLPPQHLQKHIFCFLSSKMASERSRSTSTYKEGEGDGERVCTFKKKKCTDIITLQLIHLTSLSLSPHPHWSRKNFSVGLFYDSMYSLFLFSHSPPPKKKNQSAKNISSFAEEVKNHQSLSKLPVISFVY